MAVPLKRRLIISWDYHPADGLPRGANVRYLPRVFTPPAVSRLGKQKIVAALTLLVPRVTFHITYPQRAAP